MTSKNFTRINNDVNGNPRYVCHFYTLLTKEESGYNDGTKYHEPTINGISAQYAAAVKRANTIGGKKYSGKNYGGGIVFQSYNIDALAALINEITGN